LRFALFMSRVLPIVHNQSIVAETELFCVQALDLEFSNGQRRHYQRLLSRSGGAVMVAALQDRDTVLLVREYAAGLHRYELGLPKGRVEHGEDVLQAANRELQEETGHAARRLRELHRLSLAPNYMQHSIQLILAEDLYPQQLDGDEPEPLDVVPWKLSRLDELLAGGECSEARSIAALYMVRDYAKRLD
jgi:ADP-ribose diphosphatase